MRRRVESHDVASSLNTVLNVRVACLISMRHDTGWSRGGCLALVRRSSFNARVAVIALVDRSSHHLKSLDLHPELPAMQSNISAYMPSRRLVMNQTPEGSSPLAAPEAASLRPLYNR